MNFSELTDDEWNMIVDILPASSSQWPRRGRPHSDARRIVNAILWILTTGKPWSEIPFRYPSIPTIRRRYAVWKTNGILNKLISILSTYGRPFPQKWMDAITSSPPVGQRAQTNVPLILPVGANIPSTFTVAYGDQHSNMALVNQQDRGFSRPSNPIDSRHFPSPRTVKYILSVLTTHYSDGTIHAVAEITIKDESNMLGSALAGAQFPDVSSAKKFAFDWGLNQILEYK